MDKLSIDFLKKYGSLNQLGGLEQFGKSSFNVEADKIENSYDIKKFIGNYENFRNTELGRVMNGNELEAAFKIIDADNDGKISEEEAADFAKAGGGNSTDKIDNSDIKALYEAGKQYAEENTTSTVSVTPFVSTVINPDGTKTTEEVKEDGTKIVTIYKQGKKISSETTSPTGKKTKNTYNYNKSGKVISSETKTWDKNGNLISGSYTSIQYLEDGTKTVGKTDFDGNRTVTAQTVTNYNKNGQKTDSVKTTPDGTVDKTTYTYSNGKLESSQTQRTVKNLLGETQQGITTTIQYVDGKQSTKSVTDSSGNTLELTQYYYTKDGKLKNNETLKSDGRHIVREYDTDTGKIKTAVVRDQLTNQITQKDYYDSKTGRIMSRTQYSYNIDGSKKQTNSYTYDSEGKLKTRDIYNSKNQNTVTSTYYHNSDGTILRTDRNPESGKVKSTTELRYNPDGTTNSTVTKDLNGNVTQKKEYTYYPSGIRESAITRTYNKDGSYTKTEINYDTGGLKISSTSENHSSEDGVKQVFLDNLNEKVKEYSKNLKDTTLTEEQRNKFLSELETLYSDFVGKSDKEEDKQFAEVALYRAKSAIELMNSNSEIDKYKKLLEQDNITSDKKQEMSKLLRLYTVKKLQYNILSYFVSNL